MAESICPARFVGHSIPVFVPQVEIWDGHGKFLGRADFANERAEVIAEFDGPGKACAGE